MSLLAYSAAPFDPILPKPSTALGGFTTESISLAQKYGLAIQRVAWEDTARSKGSCWGPNISDMTLTANGVNASIIRKPNFADLTSDQDFDSFTVNVGNEVGGSLKAIPLR